MMEEPTATPAIETPLPQGNPLPSLLRFAFWLLLASLTKRWSRLAVAHGSICAGLLRSSSLHLW